MWRLSMVCSYSWEIGTPSPLNQSMSSHMIFAIFHRRPQKTQKNSQNFSKFSDFCAVSTPKGLIFPILFIIYVLFFFIFDSLGLIWSLGIWNENLHSIVYFQNFEKKLQWNILAVCTEMRTQNQPRCHKNRSFCFFSSKIVKISHFMPLFLLLWFETIPMFDPRVAHQGGKDWNKKERFSTKTMNASFKKKSEK